MWSEVCKTPSLQPPRVACCTKISENRMLLLLLLLVTYSIQKVPY